MQLYKAYQYAMATRYATATRFATARRSTPAALRSLAGIRHQEFATASFPRFDTSDLPGTCPRLPGSSTEGPPRATVTAWSGVTTVVELGRFSML